MKAQAVASQYPGLAITGLRASDLNQRTRESLATIPLLPGCVTRRTIQWPHGGQGRLGRIALEKTSGPRRPQIRP